MTDDQSKPEKPADAAVPPKEETPFSIPPLQEIGKSNDPPGLERRDG